MKKFIDFVNEASVKGDDTIKASDKIIKFLEKSLSKNYTFINGELYTNNDGQFFGFFYISGDNSAIRVNWEGNTFHSISVWNNFAEDNTPTKEIFTKKIVPGNSSFVKLLPEIANVISGSAIEEVAEDINEARDHYEWNGNEYNSRVALIRAMYEADEELEDIAAASNSSVSYVRNYINQYRAETGKTKKAAGESKLVVKSGSKEIVAADKYARKADQLLADTEYADPEVVFKNLDSYLRLVCKGYMPALMITGQGGIGKSYNVNTVIKEEGLVRHEDFEIVKGRSSAKELYRTLWYNRDKLVIFDDCDSIFDTADGMNILKGALDSSEIREISWMTSAPGMVSTVECDSNDEIAAKVAEWEEAHNKEQGTPNHFFFEGQVIFISNLTRNDIMKKDRALLSRCTYVDIVLSAQDIIKRIGTCLPHIKIYKAVGRNSGRDITDAEIKKEVYEYISSDAFLKNPKVRGKEMNFRNFNKIYMYRHAGLENWKELAFAI